MASLLTYSLPQDPNIAIRFKSFPTHKGIINVVCSTCLQIDIKKIILNTYLQTS